MGNWYFLSTDQFATRISYDAQDRQEYIGECDAKNQNKFLSAVWRIKKIIYDANNNILAITWADGTMEFDKVWSDRATYTY